MKQHVITRAALALIVALSLSAPLQAEADDVKAKLDKERISLDLKETPVVKILELYRTLLGVDVRIRCEKERPLTIAFDNITVRTSLNAICESAGLRWSLVESEPQALLIECQDSAETVPTEDPRAAMTAIGSGGSELTVRAEGKPVQGKDRIEVFQPAEPPADRLELVVSMKLEDAPLEKVLKMAARLLNAKLIMDIGLSGEKVTLDLANISLRKFLDLVCTDAHAQWQLSSADPPLLIVEKVN